MLGEILFKIASVLTPDDIKQMKAAGCGDEVRVILGDLDKLAVSWHNGEYGVMSLVDVQIWANVRSSLDELRAVLREGYAWRKRKRVSISVVMSVMAAI
jgi:hypothetical protein